MNIVSRICNRVLSTVNRWSFKSVDPKASLDHRTTVYNHDNLIMAERTNIDAGAIIMNTRSKVIFKKNSGAAFGLTCVTGNHMSVVGLNLKQVTNEVKNKLDINNEMDKDIVVDEDVWIGNNVTLLSGVHVGRGCEIGAGSVVRGSIPPYAVVIGNPCKIVGFRFTPDEIIEHEKAQYEESERLPLELLQKNYEKYFLNRIKEVKQFTKL